MEYLRRPWEEKQTRLETNILPVLHHTLTSYRHVCCCGKLGIIFSHFCNKMMVLCEESLTKLHFWRNICAAQKNTKFPSLYQCIDNLGPVISVWKQVSDWTIGLIKPSYWSQPSDPIIGPILQYYCLYQLSSVATSLSNSNIWQKIEIKQITWLGLLCPNKSLPNMMPW